LSDLGRTKRLWLRAPISSDLPEILRLWTHAEVTRHIGGPREAAQVVETFKRYAADPHGMVAEERDRWWSIIERSTGSLAGLAALLEKDVVGTREMELSYFLFPEFWGRGYATEALRCVVPFAAESLDVPSIIAVIDPHNAPSQRVAERLGMHFERARPRSEWGHAPHLPSRANFSGAPRPSRPGLSRRAGWVIRNR